MYFNEIFSGFKIFNIKFDSKKDDKRDDWFLIEDASKFWFKNLKTLYFFKYIKYTEESIISY